MQKLLKQYHADMATYSKAVEGLGKKERPEVEAYITDEETRISWTRSLKGSLKRLKPLAFDPASIVPTSYRPFAPRWLYFSRQLNEMVYLMPKLFPTPHHPNIVISSTGVADRRGYSALVTNRVPNLHLTDTGQCFPMYWYEKVGEADDEEESQDELFAPAVTTGEADSFGYVRHDSITDWALDVFRQTYADFQISKEDIFWYVYGLMHSPEYRQRFAIDLKKSIPRIPLAGDFWSFSKVGRQLGHWHLNYETVEAYPLEEEANRLVMEPGDFKVGKMSFGKKDGKVDQGVIVYNGQLSLRGVPLKAYDYVVAEPPRESRRLVGVSQAIISDSASWR